MKTEGHSRQEIEGSRGLSNFDERYRNIIEAAPISITVVENGKVIFFNSHVLEVLGYTHDEMLGMPIRSIIHKEDLEKAMERYAARAAGQSEGKSTIRFVRKEGDPLWVEVTGQRIQWEGRDAVLYFSSDVTERLLSLARFPEENPQPVMRVSRDGLLLYANKASEPLTSSWTGEPRKKVPEKFLSALSRAWEMGEKQEIEIVEGSKSFIVTFVPFIVSEYVNLYARDVTEEKVLGQRLNQAQKMEAIGQLTGGIAHDFNNVLQVITGYCEALKLRQPEENQKYLAEITKAAHRAATLIGQLLAFSRKQTLRPQVIDAKDLVRSMQKMLERVLGDDIELRSFIDPNTGNVLADHGQMEQVLLNLAVNARDAMPSGGKLTLETSNQTFDEAYVRGHPGAKVGQYVCIGVSDTGVGMDKETLSRMYEPFFTTKEEGKGTGLGLSTVYGIVRQSEGYINCYSELGQGTTFTIYLPLNLEIADKPKAPASITTAPRGTETILLVDDDSAVRSITRIALETAGYVVIEAPGGEEALSAVSTHSITVALLVTDVVMQRMSGKELSLKLKEICPDVRVLYASGYTANVISHHGILEAGVDYLQKPFSSFEFLIKVREILDRP